MQAQAAVSYAAAKAPGRAGKAWDVASVKVLRQAVQAISKRRRQEARAAAQAMTPEARERSRAAVVEALAAWSEQQRQATEERRNSFVRRAVAEQDRMTTQADPVVLATSRDAEALAAAMRSPVRSIPTSRNP